MKIGCSGGRIRAIPTVLEQLAHLLGALEVDVLQELLQRRLGPLQQGGSGAGEGHPKGGFPRFRASG